MTWFVIVAVALLAGFGAAIHLSRRYARECERWAVYCADIEERIDYIVEQLEEERRGRTDVIISSPQFSGTLDESSMFTLGQRVRAGGTHVVQNERDGRTPVRSEPM